MGLNIFVQYGMLRYFYLVVLLVKVFYNGYKNSLNGFMHIISILYIPIGMYCIIIYLDRIGIFRTPYIRTYVCWQLVSCLQSHFLKEVALTSTLPHHAVRCTYICRCQVMTSSL